MKKQILERCQRVFPTWRTLRVEDVVFVAPKGFSSFTTALEPQLPVEPAAVFYRQLDGKENAILDFEAEREVFLTLGAEKIAAHCHFYGPSYRLEAFYEGRTLTADDLRNADVLKGIADELYRLHQLAPKRLPKRGFFELLHEKWGALAKHVLVDQRDEFPPNERLMCDELTAIYSAETFERVRRSLPDGPLSFCHNDTYTGNIMKLANGETKLLDFEFSSLNHRAYDFSNLFAETVMRHKLAEYPYFDIAEPSYTTEDIAALINFYLDNETFSSSSEREAAFETLLNDTQRLLIVSHYKYAMAALPLAIEPIQKLRFIPYAHARFLKFLNT